MQIAEDTVVSIHYTLRNDRDEVMDQSQEDAPLQYLHGRGQIIPGLESALGGKEQGAHLSVSVPPEQAYGERQEALVQAVPRSAFEGVDNVQPGMQFQAETPMGPQVITVSEVKDEEVVVDGNHPLAGETLHFEVDVVNVREATEEERSEGRAG